jgi:hypothetical protein
MTGAFASIAVPVDDAFLKVQSLQGSTRRFITPEAYRAHKLSMNSTDSPDLSTPYASTVRQSIPKGTTARMNVLDYLA